MTKELKIKVKNISIGQWSTLLLELNLIAKSWKKFGVEMKLQAPSIERIIKIGTSNKRQASDTIQD